jgi:hypothetical protein
VEEPGENTPFSLYKNRWKDNVKKHLQEFGWVRVNRIALARTSGGLL